KQLNPDIKKADSKAISYLCKSCFNTVYEDCDWQLWQTIFFAQPSSFFSSGNGDNDEDAITPSQNTQLSMLMKHQQEEFLISALFTLMQKKHASPELRERIELLIGD